MGLRVVLVASLLSVLALEGATLQSRNQRHPELGLTLSVPPEFEAVPLPPEETQVVLRFTESAPKGTGRRVRPGCDFVRLPAGQADAYLGVACRDWELDRRRGRSGRWGYRTRAYDLTDAAQQRVGYAHVWESDERDLVYLAVCAAEDEGELLTDLRRLGERAKLDAPRRDDRRRAALERRYGGGRWADPEHRIAVGLALVDGWEAFDSKHYVVVHHGLDGELVREVVEHIEVLRDELGKQFAASLPADVVSTVRLCRDRDEYLAYGGPPQFAGYWNSRAEELVLFDPGPDAPDELRRTLYHELFHQFVYHATGGVTPHPFFGEGWADYVSGAVLERGRIARIEMHPWRKQQISDLLAEGELVPWGEFLEFEPDEFYELLLPAYAQAWSLVAFLESRRASRDPGLKGRLGEYFETLRRVFAEERERFPGYRYLPAESYTRARSEALKAFVAGLDLEAFERSWREFAEEL